MTGDGEGAGMGKQRGPTETRRAELEQELDQVVGQLRALGARKVILFGSLARGQVRRGSDLDLLALFDDKRGFKERMRYVYAHLESNEDVDVLAYSFEEFERLKHRSFFRHVLREGRILYEA